MTNRQKITKFAALIAGFIASYLGQLWIFILAFVLLLLLIIGGKPTERDQTHPAREHAQQAHQQESTIAGFLFILGAVLAFIFKYYIIGIA